jgi:hypothetical protein
MQPNQVLKVAQDRQIPAWLASQHIGDGLPRPVFIEQPVNKTRTEELFAFATGLFINLQGEVRSSN